LLISVMNPSIVFDEVAVQMKCDVTVTAAEAGAAAKAACKAVASMASAATPTPTRVERLRFDPMTTPPSHG
jgi:hypothetical protein